MTVAAYHDEYDTPWLQRLYKRLRPEPNIAANSPDMSLATEAICTIGAYDSVRAEWLEGLHRLRDRLQVNIADELRALASVKEAIAYEEAATVSHTFDAAMDEALGDGLAYTPDLDPEATGEFGKAFVEAIDAQTEPDPLPAAPEPARKKGRG